MVALRYRRYTTQHCRHIWPVDDEKVECYLVYYSFSHRTRYFAHERRTIVHAYRANFASCSDVYELQFDGVII